MIGATGGNLSETARLSRSAKAMPTVEQSDRPYSQQDIDQAIAAIHAGVFEQPYWTSFLAHMRRVTVSDYASMSFRRADARAKDTIIIKSGDQGCEVAGNDDDLAAILRCTKLPYMCIEVNRPYSLQEILVLEDEQNRDYVAYLRRRHFTDTYVIRIAEEGAGNVWLTFGCSKGLYARWMADLLRQLAPHVAIAARTLARLESERVRTDIARDAVQKLNFGWLTFDMQGRVIEIDPGAESLFRKIPSLAGCRIGQIFPRRRGCQSDLVDFLSAAADAQTFPPRAIHLVDEPWVDMLIVPVRYRTLAGGATPIAVGYVHGVGVASAARCEQLIQLFGLTASEARLALVLSQGRSIADAAAEVGLTIETARNYSKRIYAKTDTRGQADLVRIILASVIALS